MHKNQRESSGNGVEYRVSRSAWTLNYELIWEDGSAKAVGWVQEEFDALWHSPFALPLAEFILQDIERLSRREVVASRVGTFLLR
ncbi:MAG: hypothetical protein ACREXW_16810 [Gammaproteobacteria bacterium]